MARYRLGSFIQKYGKSPFIISVLFDIKWLRLNSKTFTQYMCSNVVVTLVTELNLDSNSVYSASFRYISLKKLIGWLLAISWIKLFLNPALSNWIEINLAVVDFPDPGMPFKEN